MQRLCKNDFSVYYGDRTRMYNGFDEDRAVVVYIFDNFDDVSVERVNKSDFEHCFVDKQSDCYDEFIAFFKKCFQMDLKEGDYIVYKGGLYYKKEGCNQVDFKKNEHFYVN